MIRRARRDANEVEIVRALERIGCVVYRCSSAGLPDLLVWKRGVWYPIEVKTKGGRLTDAQIETFKKTPFEIVASVDEALAIFGVRI